MENNLTELKTALEVCVQKVQRIKNDIDNFEKEEMVPGNILNKADERSLNQLTEEKQKWLGMIKDIREKMEGMVMATFL